MDGGAIGGLHGTENRPGQLLTTTLLAQPNFHSTQPWQNPKPVFYTKPPVYHFNPAGPPGIAQTQASPGRPWVELIVIIVIILQTIIWSIKIVPRTVLF